MVKLLVILALIAVAAAAPQKTQNADVQLLRYDSNNDGLGAYKYNFELSDGTKRDEQGELINAGTDNESISVKGSYEWVGPDDITYTITYVADDNGFRPTVAQGPSGGVPIAVVEALLKNSKN